MLTEDETLKRAREALNSICGDQTASTHAPRTVQAATLQLDPEVWRESVAEWLNSECICHWRCHSSVSSLYRDYCGWELSRRDAPCTRDTFTDLLSGSSFIVSNALVAGVMLRADLDAVCNYPGIDRLFRDSTA